MWLRTCFLVSDPTPFEDFQEPIVEVCSCLLVKKLHPAALCRLMNTQAIQMSESVGDAGQLGRNQEEPQGSIANVQFLLCCWASASLLQMNGD
jgi:hypothetical protein